jgi:hypothetical protein
VARLETGVIGASQLQRRWQIGTGVVGVIQHNRRHRMRKHKESDVRIVCRAEEENDRRCARRKIPGVIERDSAQRAVARLEPGVMGASQHSERWRDWSRCNRARRQRL